MADIEARLAQLGTDLPDVVPPVAAYTPAVLDGGYVYTSGQLPMVSGALPATGKVGEGHGLVPPGDLADRDAVPVADREQLRRAVVGEWMRVARRQLGLLAVAPDEPAADRVVRLFEQGQWRPLARGIPAPRPQCEGVRVARQARPRLERDVVLRERDAWKSTPPLSKIGLQWRGRELRPSGAG